MLEAGCMLLDDWCVMVHGACLIFNAAWLMAHGSWPWLGQAKARWRRTEKGAPGTIGPGIWLKTKPIGFL